MYIKYRCLEVRFEAIVKENHFIRINRNDQARNINNLKGNSQKKSKTTSKSKNTSQKFPKVFSHLY